MDGDGFALRFADWHKVWVENAVREHSGPCFASLFRLPSEVMRFVESNFHDGHESIRGWNRAKPGMVGGDIDRSLLDAALADARAVVSRLLSKGASAESFVPCFSGSKGFSLHVLAGAFGGLLESVQGLRHPAHEEAVLLALKALHGGIPFDPSSRQTIRLFRLPNSVNAKSGLFKIP